MSARRLRSWYLRCRRDLPWRRTRSAYAVWVSEIMLQQTRVAVVVPYYRRFMQRFPDVGTLARARTETVLAHWAGLGYYRRARFLHRAAKIVAREGFPSCARNWRALPGVGEYTAAAVASISLDEPIAVVDGNVERVLCRYHAVGRPDRRTIRRLAQAWVPEESPGDHNQAVMELGATICTPRSPSCDRCPLQGDCRGRADPERWTPRRDRPTPRRERLSVGFTVRRGRVLLRRLEGPGALEGMWDLPPGDPDARVLGTVRHSILDRRQVISIRDGAADQDGEWFDPRRAAALPLCAAARKCLSTVGFFQDN